MKKNKKKKDNKKLIIIIIFILIIGGLLFINKTYLFFGIPADIVGNYCGNTNIP